MLSILNLVKHKRAHNTYNVISHLTDDYHMRGKGIGVQDDFKETAVVSGSNTFSSGAFTQLSLYDEYLHRYLVFSQTKAFLIN